MTRWLTAKITGDELIDYLHDQRRTIRKWRFIDIQNRLAGRRLTFHKMRLAGLHQKRNDRIVGKPPLVLAESVLPAQGKGDLAVPIENHDTLKAGQIRPDECRRPKSRGQDPELLRKSSADWGSGLAGAFLILARPSP